jgi:trigger factor
VAFPADYQAAELAGNTVQFEMTVKKVEAPVLPELDADFAKQLGVADGDTDQDARPKCVPIWSVK